MYNAWWDLVLPAPISRPVTLVASEGLLDPKRKEVFIAGVWVDTVSSDLVLKTPLAVSWLTTATVSSSV